MWSSTCRSLAARNAECALTEKVSWAALPRVRQQPALLQQMQLMRHCSCVPAEILFSREGASLVSAALAGGPPGAAGEPARRHVLAAIAAAGAAARGTGAAQPGPLTADMSLAACGAPGCGASTACRDGACHIVL